MGGWVGRIAYRYRIPVADLLDRTGLPGQALGAPGWWLLPVLPQTQIARLAEAARLSPDVLEALQTPEAWFTPRSELAYCAHCLFMNPVNVFHPRWMRVWFDPDLSDRCGDCSRVHAWIRTADLRRCLHLGQLLRAVSRLEELRRRAAEAREDNVRWRAQLELMWQYRRSRLPASGISGTD